MGCKKISSVFIVFSFFGKFFCTVIICAKVAEFFIGIKLL